MAVDKIAAELEGFGAILNEYELPRSMSWAIKAAMIFSGLDLKALLDVNESLVWQNAHALMGPFHLRSRGWCLPLIYRQVGLQQIDSRGLSP